MNLTHHSTLATISSRRFDTTSTRRFTSRHSVNPWHPFLLFRYPLLPMKTTSIGHFLVSDPAKFRCPFVAPPTPSQSALVASPMIWSFFRRFKCYRRHHWIWPLFPAACPLVSISGRLSCGLCFQQYCLIIHRFRLIPLILDILSIVFISVSAINFL
ncbi:hypothetical protein OWV82_004721 [Melia azedarach]|uniref:Uncharacterized protein n=1 Tax=Melia azedarach TaxID=155640 RepID=A0ACC1YS23_MELAZ|nr:hypothetical protein OWV82_004721 [Melia azedarach]